MPPPGRTSPWGPPQTPQLPRPLAIASHALGATDPVARRPVPTFSVLREPAWPGHDPQRNRAGPAPRRKSTRRPFCWDLQSWSDPVSPGNGGEMWRRGNKCVGGGRRGSGGVFPNRHSCVFPMSRDDAVLRFSHLRDILKNERENGAGLKRPGGPKRAQDGQSVPRTAWRLLQLGFLRASTEPEDTADPGGDGVGRGGGVPHPRRGLSTRCASAGASGDTRTR